MPSGNTLTEIATRHQIFLERLKTQEARGFSAVLRDIEKGIVEIINDLEVSNLSQLNRRSMNATLTKMRRLQTKLLNKNQKAFMKTLREISDYEIDFEVRTLTQELEDVLGRKKIATPATEAAFTASVSAPLSANGELLEPFIKRFSESQIQAIDGAVRRAWVEGRTPGQLVQEIRGTRAMKYKNGIIRGLKTRQAEAMARTAIQHIASNGRMAVWERNDSVVKKYKFIATLDSRTTTICRHHDGKEYEFGKGPRPPLHIGCRSTTTGVLVKKYDFLSKGATRASKTGYVDAKQTYYSWLKQQPPRFQDQALGKTRGKLFRDGGLSAEQFGRLQLDKNFRPMTLEQMKLAEPAIFDRAGLN